MEIVFTGQAELLAALEESNHETLAFFDLPPAALALSYAPGKWTIRQLLHHLADAETVLYERIRRGIASPGQVVWGFDPDAWADKLNYATRDLASDRAIYAAIRRGIVLLAQTHYEPHGHQQYVHNETGLRTVKQEFDKVAWHNMHHLQQLRQALKQQQ
ncbi:MAG: metal-dependent hydrolase [Bacteroidetes bacterium]|nr:MAG: metal-dependent hydrolase [Bacteroidota bacterium]PTM09596.1 MAG: metal-dependent hydrolase [Bacteroidota bacterium]